MPFQGRVLSWSTSGRIKFQMISGTTYEYAVDGAWLTNAMPKYRHAVGKLFADVKARASMWRKDGGEWIERQRIVSKAFLG